MCSKFVWLRIQTLYLSLFKFITFIESQIMLSKVLGKTQLVKWVKKIIQIFKNSFYQNENFFSFHFHLDNSKQLKKKISSLAFIKLSYKFLKCDPGFTHSFDRTSSCHQIDYHSTKSWNICNYEISFNCTCWIIFFLGWKILILFAWICVFFFFVLLLKAFICLHVN